MLEDGDTQNDRLKNANTKSSSAPKMAAWAWLFVACEYVTENRGGLPNRAVVQVKSKPRQLNPLVTADLWDGKMEFEWPLSYNNLC